MLVTNSYYFGCHKAESIAMASNLIAMASYMEPGTQFFDKRSTNASKNQCFIRNDRDAAYSAGIPIEFLY